VAQDCISGGNHAAGVTGEHPLAKTAKGCPDRPREPLQAGGHPPQGVPRVETPRLRNGPPGPETLQPGSVQGKEIHHEPHVHFFIEPEKQIIDHPWQQY